MLDYDRGFKIIARAAGRQLARMAGVECRGWTPIVSEGQATTERLADRGFRGRARRQRFVVYMEFYTYWNHDVPWSVLAKSALLSERERLPTMSLVYVLRPRGYHDTGGTHRLAIEGQPSQQVWFREIRLWEQEPQDWWED